jgi:hypothetical protein
MRKPSEISKVPRPVLFNQLKNHTNSEELRSLKEESSSPRPLPREELSLPLGNSNSMLRNPLLMLHAPKPTERVSLITPDSRLNVRE